MSEPSQVLTISRAATAFTAVCEVCLGIDTAVGLSASTFAASRGCLASRRSSSAGSNTRVAGRTTLCWNRSQE